LLRSYPEKEISWEFQTSMDEYKFKLNEHTSLAALAMSEKAAGADIVN
jgi:hypothetical protein